MAEWRCCLEDDAVARRIIADLLDAGWTPPAAHQQTRGETEMSETIRAHVYAWAKAAGLDTYLTTADYDDLARRLACDTEWTWRHNAYVSTANATTDRAEAERSVEGCRAANPGDPVTLMRRTVTPWAVAEAQP